MRIKIGVMGSAASESARLETGNTLVEKAERLAAQGQTLITATERAQLPELCERAEVRVHGGDVSALALAA